MNSNYVIKIIKIEERTPVLLVRFFLVLFGDVNFSRACESLRPYVDVLLIFLDPWKIRWYTISTDGDA